MNSGTEDEEPNLFLRNEDQDQYGGGTSDDWDDTQLVKAYDRAVSAVKREIFKRVQHELGLKDEDVEEFISDAESLRTKAKKTKNKKKNKQNKEKNWQVGNSCRAVYSEDGQEYEAVLVEILDSELCVVRFVGYENEEIVSLNELTPSLGKNVVKVQMEMANTVAEEGESEKGESKEEGELSETEVKEKATSPKAVPRLNFMDPSYFHRMSRHPTFVGTPPLPPPMPPNFMQYSMKNTMANTRDDGVSSMLMSWYMCGYYTGYYHRELHQEENNSKT